MSDADHLALAVAIGGGDEARTSPNPTVGCVVVDAGGAVVGRGRTEPAGGRHAEVVALAEAGPAARRATAYVTLEPCDHAGRTGPCSRALLDAGVDRVVVARRDPVPGHGGGVERLRAAGVIVSLVADDGWSSASMPRFLRRAATRRAWVTLKLAHDEAGATVAADGGWITGPVARARVHAQRARHDAVLVGVGTVLGDDPRLDVRHVDAPHGQPRPVVLDSDARTPPSARVVARGGLVVVGAGADPVRVRGLRDAGASVLEVPRAGDGRVDLDHTLVAVRGSGLHDVYAEPGDTLSSALVAASCVDELVLHRPRAAHAARAAAWSAHDAWRWRSATALGADREDVWTPRRPPDRRLADVRAWLIARRDVVAAALVGSHARGRASLDSDLDVVLLVTDPDRWLTDRTWLAAFGPHGPVTVEDWGAVRSLRTHLLDGQELEVAVGHPDWASVPLDPGTAGVLAAGCLPLHDPQGVLAAALAAVSRDVDGRPDGRAGER